LTRLHRGAIMRLPQPFGSRQTSGKLRRRQATCE